MFFGAVEQFASALLQTHTDPETLILRLRRVPFMDATGIQTLDEVCTKLRRRGVQVVLTEANERVLAKLQKAHVVPQSASDHYAAAFGDALRLALMHAASRDDAPDPAPDASRQGLSAVAERLIDTSRRYLQDRNCR
jgi:SulP family sulfate permease